MGYIMYDSIRRPKNKRKKNKTSMTLYISQIDKVTFRGFIDSSCQTEWMYTYTRYHQASLTSSEQHFSSPQQVKWSVWPFLTLDPTQQLKYRTSSAATNTNVAFHFSFSGREKIKRRQNFHWFLLMCWKGYVHTRHYHQETGRLARTFKNKPCLTFHRPFSPFSYIYSMDYIGCILLSVWCTVGYFKCAT